MTTTPWHGVFDRADGSVRRPLAMDAWYLPAKVAIQGEWLISSWIDPKWWRVKRLQEWKDLRPTASPPGAELLEQFVRLADATPKEILGFARRWGILEICEHNLPQTHDQACVTSAAKRSAGSPTTRELLRGWRSVAQWMDAVMRLAAALDRGADGDQAAWDIVTMGKKRYPTYEMTSKRPLLAAEIEQWLGWVRLRLKFGWDDPRPTLTIAADGLLGALLLQLVITISRIDGLAICTECRRTYIPTRRPRRGQRNYCQKCEADRVPIRDAARAYRARRRNLTSGRERAGSKRRKSRP